MNEYEKMKIQKLFDSYFMKKGCTNIFNITNKYSQLDFWLTSGDTNGNIYTIVGEYKDRSNISVATYVSSIIEKQKLKALMIANKLLNAPAFYVVEYTEVYLIYQVDQLKEDQLKADVIPMPLSNSTDQTKLKEVYHLNVYDAHYIVSKRTFNNGTVDQLKEYITLTNNQ